MGQVNVTINGRGYDITCDDGQEAHLQKLAEFIDKQVQELAESVGPVGEPRLLVMTALTIADELYDAYNQIDAQKLGGQGAGTDGNAASGNATSGNTIGSGTAKAVENCAARLESIAARLENA